MTKEAYQRAIELQHKWVTVNRHITYISETDSDSYLAELLSDRDLRGHIASCLDEETVKKVAALKQEIINSIKEGLKNQIDVITKEFESL